MRASPRRPSYSSLIKVLSINNFKYKIIFVYNKRAIDILNDTVIKVIIKVKNNWQGIYESLPVQQIMKGRGFLLEIRI